MDFLNQSLAQTRELFQSMTPAGRVTAVLLLGVLVDSMGYLFQHHSAGPDEFLFNGTYLPAEDADRAEAAIAQAGLNDYQRVGNRIRVPAGQKAESLAEVANAGALPANFHSVLEEALNLGAFVDPETRRQRMKAAREQQLSMIIRAMHGIEKAQVFYDYREPRGLSRKSVVTATVSVEPTPGEPLEPRTAKMIKKAVAGAIVGLSTEKVTIANLGDGILLGGGDSFEELFDDPYYQHRLSYEKYMKSSIENLLTYIPGIRVEVSAELDKAIHMETRTNEPAGDPVPIREQTVSSESTQSRTAPGGQVGLIAQGASRTGEKQGGSKLVDKTTEEQRNTQNRSGTKESLLRESGLVPESVRASIASPRDYLIQVWRERQKRLGEDVSGDLPIDIDTQLQGIQTNITDDINTVVAQLLPKHLAEDRHQYVSVTFFETLPSDPIEGPSAANVAMAWASQNFGTMTMAAIALVGLLMLRSLVKGMPPAEPVTSVAGPTLSINLGEQDSSAAGGGGSAEQAQGEEAERPRLKLNKGSNLKDDLTEIVREDPDAAAAILRGWISNAD